MFLGDSCGSSDFHVYNAEFIFTAIVLYSFDNAEMERISENTAPNPMSLSGTEH